MNKISIEHEFNVKELERLKAFGYPECNKVPLTTDEIRNLKIGTACYIAPMQSRFRLVMFAGYFECVDTFVFYSDMGVGEYRDVNAGKTYNVFLANMEV